MVKLFIKITRDTKLFLAASFTFVFILIFYIHKVFVWKQRQIFGSPRVEISSSFHLTTSLHLNRCRLKEERTVSFRYLDVKLVCQRREKKCLAWHWDVANWTLFYSNDDQVHSPHGNPTRFCPIPIHGLRTAKIVYPNGTEDFPGCVNSKYPCSQTMDLYYASYDNDLQMRINRSPCCRKLLLDITKHTTRIFDKYNITYFFNGGVVIGLVRDNGRFIPYDTDTDISVDFNDFEKVTQAFPELEKTGYIYKWKPEYTNGSKRYMIGCTNAKCLTGPGIAFYSVKNGMVSAPVQGWMSVPANLTLPPIRRMFEGVETSFPRDPEGFLDYVYGKDKWRTPLDCANHYFGQCKGQ